ncbi:hypothetical protein HDU96_005229 [Phlyctochytrium bullatum]|nr:hypothetical protein HDU96_005229 [Phlyctochytrium bullatum]
MQLINGLLTLDVLTASMASTRLPAATTRASAPAASATVPSQATDGNCAELIDGRLHPLPDIYACYNAFPISNELKAAETDTLRRFYNVYPFGDINAPSFTGVFGNKVDFLERLDEITATATNYFDYFSQVMLLVRSMDDAHFSFDADCITTFTLMQPCQEFWHKR